MCLWILLTLADYEQEQLREHLRQIGHTPIKKVYFVIDGRPRKVHLKLEGTNQGMSGISLINVSRRNCYGSE